MSFPGTSLTSSQLAARGAVLAEVEDHLRLQRVGVLELVHQDVVEERLVAPAQVEPVAEEVAQPQEEVHLVHGAMARLHPLVHRHHHRRGAHEAQGEPALERPEEVVAERPGAQRTLPSSPSKAFHAFQPASSAVKSSPFLNFRDATTGASLFHSRTGSHFVAHLLQARQEARQKARTPLPSARASGQRGQLVGQVRKRAEIGGTSSGATGGTSRVAMKRAHSASRPRREK